ncbi:peptidase domain-containing ABC transporter [Thauera sp.]|uniref:peptidase domain-containing ABC transporter n=1 Tax=Thauera sp. TaxID=1905334 RepID=UPI0039E69C29
MQPVLQAENQECGLACLAMIASAHGMDLRLADLRRRFPVSMRGTTLAQLMRLAQQLGFSCRPLRLEPEEFGKLRLPCILHWDMNHFVVLTKVAGRRLTILDPAHGRRVIDADAASPHFTGVGLELTPGTTFKPVAQAPRIRLRELTGQIFGLKRALANILVLALAIEIVGLLIPQVTQWVVDGALVSADRDLLLIAVLGGGLLMVFDFVLRMARGWIGLRLNQQLSIQWSANLFSHLMRLPWGFFEKRSLGDIAARFQSLGAIRNVLANGAITAVLDGLVTLVTLGMMFLYSTTLSAVVLAALLFYGLLRWAFYQPLRNASEERIVLAAKENAYFLESIRAALPLKLFGAAPLRVATWQNMVADVQNRDVKTQRMLLAFSSANTLIFGMEGMLLLYIGGLAVLDRGLSLGMLLAFIAYKSQFTSRASRLIDLAIEVRMLSLHAERIADIALEMPEPDETTSVAVPAVTDVRVEFRNVSFRYGDGEPWILRNFSLTIEAGESVAMVGQSGCGKSTVFKLLLGLLRPAEGEVLIGGVSVRQLGPAAVRNLVGVVMQEDRLLAGTLAENIACFDPEANRERIEEAARKAHIHHAIMKMPMGYETLVAELGSGLSGGQKQRLLLARLLYRMPSIIALDEATSHLDLHSEQHVVRALQQVKATRITIAHRPETVTLADRIVRLDGGVVVEDVRIERPVLAA